MKGVRRILPAVFLLIALAGAAAADNKALLVSINGQGTEKTDTNLTSNLVFNYSNPAYWNTSYTSTIWYLHARLYLPPNNATEYSKAPIFRVDYAKTTATYYKSNDVPASCTPYCYNGTTWTACSMVPPTANISILRCRVSYNKNKGIPTGINFNLTANAPFVLEDSKNQWMGRDYGNDGGAYSDPAQVPINEYWGNTTTSTPAINITNASAPSSQKTNLGRLFYYNITVRNENATNHSGRAYRVFLYSLTDGITVASSTPKQGDLPSNGSQEYRVAFMANRTMVSFAVGAQDNRTAARAAFNNSYQIGTINITDQLLIGAALPTNQSYKGETTLSFAANITDANGVALTSNVSAYANISGIATGIPVYLQSGLYRGNYTINTRQPTPWTIVFYANDTYRNIGTNSTQFYDTVPPRVENATARNITDRQNATVNASAWDALGVSEVTAQVYWTTTGLLKNYTLTNYSANGYSAIIPNAEVVPGTHNVTMFAKDTSGNTNLSATITFRVNDTTPPMLENASIRDSGENESAFLNVSAWDIMNVSTVWVGINATTSYLMYKQSGNTYNLTLPLLSAGTYNLTFRANDTSGNTNTTTGTLHINDTTPPAILVIKPETGAQVKYGEAQGVIVNATDNYAGVDLVWMIVDSNQSKTYYLNYTNGLYNGSVLESTGTHKIEIYANDTKNNAKSVNASFTVIAETVISDLTPSLPSPQNAGKNITWTTNVTNAYATIYYQYNLSRDGGITWATGSNWNESNTFTWRTNQSDRGITLVRVYISNATAILGNRTSAPYNISTGYRLEATQLQYAAYMRGENVTFAAKAYDVQNQEVTNAQATAALMEGQALLAYNGTHYTGTFTVPSNATPGNWTANVSISDIYNSVNALLGFNISAHYAMELLEPYANDTYIRGDSALVNLRIKNVRGEPLYNISGVNAYLQKGGNSKKALGLAYSGDRYQLYFPFAFNTTDEEGLWEVFANTSQSGNSGNASINIALNATLLISANPAPTEVYTPLRINFTIDRANTIRPKENASIGSDAYLRLNNTETVIQSSMPAIGNTPLTTEYAYGTENNGTQVNRIGQWKLGINISSNKNYGETETTIPVVDTQKPTAKTVGIGDNYRGKYFDNSDGAQAYPNDVVLLRATHLDNFNTTAVNLTITSPGISNTTIQMEKYWSRECLLGLQQQDCDDAAGSAFNGAAYQISKWNASFSQTLETGNYTIAKIESWDSSGNRNAIQPGYRFGISTISITTNVNPPETNISLPVAITAQVRENLTAVDYVRVNISGKEGNFEYDLGAGVNYTSTRSEGHTVTVKVKSANHTAENTTYFWVNYGTPALTTKLEDNQAQLNGTYKTVNMSITAVGGDLKNVRLGSTTTNKTQLTPDADENTMAILGDINSDQTIIYQFGFTANDTGTVNITMLIQADTRNGSTSTYETTYANYSIVLQDTQPPTVWFANTTTLTGYANINESAKIYAKITDNVEVAGATISMNCTDTSYNRTGAPMEEDTINAEHVWSYRFNFTGGPANCSFNISATDASGQEATPKWTGLSASTEYQVTATKAGAEPLLRAEEINFTINVRTTNGNAIEDAAVTYNLTKPDGSTSTWAGGYTSGYLTLQSDPDGTYLLRLNASKYGNTGYYSLNFSVNSSLSLDPQYTLWVIRGNRLTFDTSVKNARGQNYDATVNLTFLGQTAQLQKTFALYTRTQEVPMATQPGSETITIFAYVNNNTATAALPVTILPANLTIQTIRAYNTLREDLAIGRGDNITITLELYAQNGEGISGANITAQANTGETVNFTHQYGSQYYATAIINVSQTSTWSLNMTAQYGSDNPARAQLSLLPINKKWRDVDEDSHLEFAEDRDWLEVYDTYRDTSQYLGMYSRDFYHFPLSPHNGFMIITPLSYSPTVPDKFWSPYDDVNTSVAYLDISPSQGNGPGNPYEYYVDINGDGNFERQYADGQLNTISGKRLVCTDKCQTPITNGTAIGYAFDLHSPLASLYDLFLDTHGGVTILCGGVKQTQKTEGRYSAYLLGFAPLTVPRVYWDAETNAQYKVYEIGTGVYYVDIDSNGDRSNADLRFTVANGTCTFNMESCGKGGCQPEYGETVFTCPQDCASTTPPGQPPGGGGTPTGPQSAAQIVAKTQPNATEKETEVEGLEVIVQSPTNLLVTQGNNLTFQITLASTSKEYPLELSFYTNCCEYTYTPESLTLQKGSSADVTVQVKTTLLTKTGDYAGEFTVRYRNYTKSRRIDIKVEGNPSANEFSALKRELLLLKESIRQLNQSSPDTEKADEEYKSILSSIAEAEKAVSDNDAGRLASIVQQAKARQQGLSDTVKVLMKKQGIEEQKAAIVLPQPQSYLWLIALITVLVVGSAMSITFKEQIQQKMFKRPPEEELAERIEELKAEEARISQMKKSTEREYFSRKLDQKTFIHIMSEYESKQIDTKARIAEAQQKLGELTKPKSSGKVELLELQKTQEGRRVLDQIKKIGEWLEKGDYERAIETYREALDSYNNICGSLALEEQKFVYEELNKEYANLEEFRSVSKKTGDLYSALRNCSNCISSEKYDLARHFFEQAQSLHTELSRYERFRRNAQYGEIEKLYKQISDFHQSGA